MKLFQKILEIFSRENQEKVDLLEAALKREKRSTSALCEQIKKDQARFRELELENTNLLRQIAGGVLLTEVIGGRKVLVPPGQTIRDVKISSIPSAMMAGGVWNKKKSQSHNVGSF